MPIVKVCFTPALYHLYASSETITVVVDILRATSAICTAFEHGVEQVIPVAEVEDTYYYKADENCILAAERGGRVVEGFQFGNSPRDYMGPHVKGKTLVITTTNGTQAIEAAAQSDVVLIGSFLNISALAEALGRLQMDTMILCAGWKNRFNLEDTLFAGALTARLLEQGFSYAVDSDAAIASVTLFKASEGRFYEFLEGSSHRNRLASLNLEEDVRFCLTPDYTRCIPYMDGHIIRDGNKTRGIEHIVKEKISMAVLKDSDR
ncbi:MAG: 2-phosphosulfolactate phosphatase [Flavobacteriales bacterium]|nr:2-phosphosulfolactate phosphatase [Flavobacteriales bacterium]MCX7768671.1 2-phosphosulfolactate phosphatase [Flavobacteriales bacterium]MDW8410684.1 2-phosphosulfolactate phosphatase [Flavobacteriales bacterium]